MSTPGDLIQHLDQAVEELKRYGAEKIILFGSLARGEADEYSDIDLVVVKPTAMQFVDRLADVVRRCPGLSCADVIVYTPEELERMQEAENPFIEQVLREGKILYETPQATS